MIGLAEKTLNAEVPARIASARYVTLYHYYYYFYIFVCFGSPVPLTAECAASESGVLNRKLYGVIRGDILGVVRMILFTNDAGHSRRQWPDRTK